MRWRQRTDIEDVGRSLAVYLSRILLLLLLLWPSLASAAKEPGEEVAANLQHAWSFYWAGLLDGGDLRSFDKGLGYAKQAKEQINKLPENDPTRAALEKKHDEVVDTIQKQRAVAAVTLRGWFPLTALLKKSLFLNSGALGNYELIDDPADVAVTKLVEDLRDDVLTKWGAMPQTDVTVVSLMDDQVLEDKVLFLLSTTPRVNLRPIADVANTMDAESVAALKQGRAAEVGEKARATFGADRFIVVTIKQVDQVEDLYAIELGAQVFSGGKPATFSILGVTYDRREQLVTLLIVILISFLVGMGLTWWFTRERLTLTETLSMGTLAFLGGIAIPNAVTGLVASFEPPGAELVLLSFWWASVSCLAVVIGTPIAFTSLVKRFGNSIPALKRVTDFGPQVACATGAGVASYLGRGPIVYDTEGGWLLALLMLGCCIGASRMVSQLRARMTIEPRYMVFAVMGLALSGPAFFSDSVGGMAICAFVVIVASARAEQARRALEEEVAQASTTAPPEELDDAALTQLVSLARHPKYHAFAPFKNAHKILKDKDKKGVRWLFLYGQRGSGKTSTSEALLQSLGNDVVVLRGACSPPHSGNEPTETKPFEVFAKAFHGVGLLGFEEPEEDIFSSIEGRVISAIPIVSMLLPSGDDADGATVSDRGELYARMVRELIKQTRRGSRRVCLVLDDIQWMDSASQELLLHMMGIFGKDSDHKISFMLCGRHLPEQVENAQISERLLQRVCVELGDEDRLELLEDSIGLDKTSAHLLDEAVTDREGKSNLAWLFTLVEAVAKSGQVVFDEGSYRVTVAAGEQLPIPDNFRKVLGQTYDALPRDDQEILRIAACLGYSFNIEVIARVLERTRLEVIGELEEIGEATGIVEDDLSSDDVFKFVSTQRYLALRDHLGIRDAHPRERISQLLRDLHLRIARVLEEMMEERKADVADVANHYWASGQRDLNSALRFCRMAAKAARDVFAFEAAEFQLRRALVCAEILSQGNYQDEIRWDASRQRTDIEIELRLLPFDEAHILGRNDLRQKQAELAIEIFARDVSDGRVDVPLKLLFAMTRACYDARRFENALEMADALVELGAPGEKEVGARRLSSDDLAIRDMAYIEGLHFIGISLDPRNEADKRLEWLHRAKQEAEALDSTDEERRALQARVFNSLGEQLAQKATYDFDEARNWFHRSVALKKELKPQDKPGLARAYGGLGRLYLFAAREQEQEERERMLNLAQEFFQEDIELCKDYGDIGGECQMHSHLGECSLLLECYDEAALSYERSLELAQNPISQGFALIGLMRSRDALGEAEAASETAEKICELALEHDLPPFLRPTLLEVLDLPTVHPEGIASWDEARLALGDQPSAAEEE